MLELDCISLSHSKNKSETLRYREVLGKYLATHSEIFQKMRLEVMGYEILRVFNSQALSYPSVRMA